MFTLIKSVIVVAFLSCACARTKESQSDLWER